MRLSVIAAVFILLSGPVFASAAENAVKPYQRFRAEFEIRAAAKCYPLDWYCINVEVKYPYAELVFLNEKNKPVRQFRAVRYHAFSPKFERASIELYAPEGAAKAVLKNSGTEVRNFRIVPLETPADLALPLDHRVGGQFIKVRFTPGRDGSGVFDVTNGNLCCYPVPVEPGARYRFTVYGAKGDKSTGLVIRTYFFSNGNTERSLVAGTKEPMRIGGKHTKFTTTLRAPENARWFRAFFMWGIVYSYQLEKLP